MMKRFAGTGDRFSGFLLFVSIALMTTGSWASSTLVDLPQTANEMSGTENTEVLSSEGVTVEERINKDGVKQLDNKILISALPMGADMKSGQYSARKSNGTKIGNVVYSSLGKGVIVTDAQKARFVHRRMKSVCNREFRQIGHGAIKRCLSEFDEQHRFCK